MKKLLCALLCLCMMVALCGLGVAATEPATVTKIEVKDESNQSGSKLKFIVNGEDKGSVEHNGSLQGTGWEYNQRTLFLNSGNFDISVGYLQSSWIDITIFSGVELQALTYDPNHVEKIDNYGTISGGTFTGAVNNWGDITAGTFSGTVCNFVTITGNATLTGTVQNYGTIMGGTFDGEVENKSGATISGGTFNDPMTNENGGTISGGTFESHFNNEGTITGGTFDGEVENRGTITNGTDADGAAVVPTFSNTNVTNIGTISGGSFGESAAGINNKGKISGGTFSCGVGNNTADAVIEGGTFHADVSNERGASITGGTFSGTVHNSGSITGGTFAKDIVDKGGTVNLPQTNPDPAPVPQPVTPAPAEPVWDVEVEEEEEEIEVLKGSKQKYTQGADEGLSFRFDAKVKNFRRLKIDGKTVDKANYEVTEGSTIITLDPEYMDTLKAGKHTLKAIFKDGSAEVKFTVLEGAKVEASAPAADADKLNPSTGAAEFVGAAAALAVVSIAGAVALSKKH